MSDIVVYIKKTRAMVVSKKRNSPNVNIAGGRHYDVTCSILWNKVIMYAFWQLNS